MPVRIYDIAKKLGIENKEVIAKANTLGIKGARVPSSSLDKITAEYLEDQLRLDHPKPPPAPPPLPAITEPTPMMAGPPAEVIPEVKIAQTDVEIEHAQEIQAPEATPPESVPIAPPGPPPLPEQIPLPASAEPPAESMEPATAQAKTPEPPANDVKLPLPTPVPEAHIPAPPAAPSPEPPILAEPPVPQTPPAPTTPPPVGIGGLVGRIELPPGRFSRSTARESRTPHRPAQPPRNDFNRGRVDRAAGRPALGPAKPAPAKPPTTPPSRPADTPAEEAKYVAPADAEVIRLKPPIIVRDLAAQLNRKPFQLIADLIELKVMANVNQAIEEPVAQKLCAKYGYRFEVEKRERGAGIIHRPTKKVSLDDEDKQEDLKPRPPVITIMGHVDHGKTSLLDVIRKSNVAAGEVGGITQHIGAYTISFPHPERKDELQQLTFLDTPGHEAFTAMRARGATVTDIVVLVVAANDGVMPQTEEALSHARAAQVPIIVAVNKTDHANANPMKVRQQLQERGVVPDEWGGDTIFVDVSAITRQGVDRLLEMILLQAELLELKANPNRCAAGNVVESGLERSGPTATVLIRKGTLHVSDTVVCGAFWGKVRALLNEEGQRLKEAGPSVAVKLLGLNGIPEAGLEFNVIDDERAARQLAEERRLQAQNLGREQRRPAITLENLFLDISRASAKALKVIVKADTQGSAEAIVKSLREIKSDKVALEIILSAVGTITESDVQLASASTAIILGFATRIDNTVSDLAKREGVEIKLYSIIYELIDEVTLAMAGLLEPTLKETINGVAEVRKLFELSKGGTVAGCVVNSGRIVRGKARVLRRRNRIYEGSISTLRRFQDEVNEVRAGMECGIRIDGFNDFEPGDTVESYSVEKVTAKL